MAACHALSSTVLSAVSSIESLSCQRHTRWGKTAEVSVRDRTKRSENSQLAGRCRMSAAASFIVSTAEPTESCKEGAVGGRTSNSDSRRVPRVLTVAGSDSGAGAGIQADLKACAALGVFCMTAITAITAQNTVGVQGIHEIPTRMLEQQIASVAGDIGVDVVKTGMLPSPEAVSALASALRHVSYQALVVDPVLVASSGDPLSQTPTLPTLRTLLFPLADLVTPNLHEAAAILEEARLGAVDMKDVEGMKEAAARIHSLGPKWVLLKGGHLEASGDAVDILYDGQEFYELRGIRVLTQNTHGTGCTLAASIAAELAKGTPMLPAVHAAKEYLTGILQASAPLRIGGGAHGPLNHLPAVARWGGVGPTPRTAFFPGALRLYAVTDPGMNERWGRGMEEAVRGAIQGGATFLQIREKDADTGEFLKAASTAVGMARAAGVPLVINDRLDIALALDADGIHVGQSDMPVKTVRKLLGPDKIIGVSCKTVEQAMRAWEEGADYIGVGGVYPTSTKAGNLTIGLEGLKTVCEKSRLPVVAIGGISSKNAGTVLQYAAGSALSGVAVVSAVFDQADVVSATRNLLGVVTVGNGELTR